MASSLMQAHPEMRTKWRRLVEQMLPWYHPERERQRDNQTERIRLRSIAARILAERVGRAIDEYRRADGRRHGR
jgi:hypothetical protein